MEQLIALKELFIRAIPSFVLVWILFAFVARLFYRPLRAAMDKRRQETEGAREAASSRIALMEEKTNEYEEALRTSRADLYREQEQELGKAMERREEILKQARAKAEEKMSQSRQNILRETEDAKKALAQESQQMAQWIAQAILDPTNPTSRSTAPGAAS
jgi:F-type H+-transporting ATPase subunit b